MSPILVTGAAGFIGYHVAARLLDRGETVVGADDLNPYYDPALKAARLEQLKRHERFRFRRLDLADREATAELFESAAPDQVVHLAAQAGVRYSLEHPEAYVDANLVGFGNVLEGCRSRAVRHLVYASSSSVYGGQREMPFRVDTPVEHPISLYAATKKANELMAHSYAHLYRIPTTGLRFFTVYGPWGRPDMALFKFTRAILAGEPIAVFNHGRMERDFTYVDDIVEGVVGVLDRPPPDLPDPDAPEQGRVSELGPYRLYNIGGGRPVALMTMIRLLEEQLGREADKRYHPLQPGDVEATWADVSALEADVGYRPATSLEEGIPRFVDWYRWYHRV